MFFGEIISEYNPYMLWRVNPTLHGTKENKNNSRRTGYVKNTFPWHGCYVTSDLLITAKYTGYYREVLLYNKLSDKAW